MNISFKDYLKMTLLYVLPHHLVSRIVFRFTRIRSPIVPSAIRLFCKAFKVDLSEAEFTHPSDYATFNAFFTRRLKKGSRPIAEKKLVSPVDGTISALGKIRNGLLFQAKGIDYSLLKLVGNNEQRADKYLDGQFITIYLSPRDYHRIHMPCSGRLLEHTHVPGRLFSVANHTVNTLKG
ncbi:MAG: archaetidylserine decarboxylase, partial [bacterium]